ncbi:hypothetical protein N0V88_003209 [Collariella sp. IMI 366227]|nr:hypothetical protein N0V88_003209 [Collariella sp. IMI 366227]
MERLGGKQRKRDSQDDFSTCSASSIFNPLSPCFLPGVVFAENIWSRASKTFGKDEVASVPSVADEGSQYSPIVEHVKIVPEDEKEACLKIIWDDCLSAERDCPRLIWAEEFDDEPMTDGEVDHSSAQFSGWEGELEPEAEYLDVRKASLRRTSLYAPLPLTTKEKRMSLPCVRGDWSASRRNNLSVFV